MNRSNRRTAKNPIMLLVYLLVSFIVILTCDDFTLRSAAVNRLSRHILAGFAGCGIPRSG